MKPHRPTIIVLAIALLALFAGNIVAAPLGTAFTYQGQLADGGSAANGVYDLKFTLFDTNSGGSAIAGPVTNATVAVSNGLFTVTLDFGSGIFIGDARWLEVAVQTNGGSGFTTLTPRQQLTPAPYAFYAPSAGTANSASNLLGVLAGGLLSGTYSNALNFNNPANSYSGSGSQLTGIGTSALADNSVTSAKIVDGAVNTADIADGAVSTAKLADNSVTSAKIVDGTVTTADIADSQVTTAKLADNAVTSAKIAASTITSADLASDSASLAQVSGGRMAVSGSSVGVGTAAPTALLDVAGNARVQGLLRSGSESGTSYPPSPAGLVVRRINSYDLGANQVVAVVSNTQHNAKITLERDGTYGGFLIRYPATPGDLIIAAMGIDTSGAQKNFYKVVAYNAAAGTQQVYYDTNYMVHFECTFGDTYDSGQHLTQVILSRESGDYFWSGTLMSTYNQ